MFTRFRSELETHGATALKRRTTLINMAGKDELFYTPFEHVNVGARLVLVGITPGTTQLELAYTEAQRLIRAGASDPEILLATKQIGAFGGPSMRPNLIRMLKHFRFAQILRIRDEEDLWGSESRLLHATSVIPHAAFHATKMFAGSFSEVQATPIFWKCFLEDFVPTLKKVNSEALYIALGPTPLNALAWCVAENLLRGEQILGALAHPSTSGGSQVGYYLREKTKGDLKPQDPVRARTEWLDQAYNEMQNQTARLLGGGSAVPPEIAHVSPRTGPLRPRSC